MLERTCSIALRILDNRWLSRVRALFWLGTTGVAVVLITAGLVVAAIGFLTRIGVVPLVFIGLGVFLLLAGGTSRLRARLAGRVAPDTALTRPPLKSDLGGDLLVEVWGPQWHTFREWMIAPLRVRVTNLAGVDKRLLSVGWRQGQALPGSPKRKQFAPLTQESHQQQAREIKRLLKGRRTLPLPTVIAAGRAIEGWAGVSLAPPAESRIATPDFTFHVVDELGHQYVVAVPETETRLDVTRYPLP